MPKGDFNLPLTIKSGQTSQPAWSFKEGYFHELVVVEGKPCIIKVRQKLDDIEAPVEIIAESHEEISEKSIKAKLIDIFDLNNKIQQVL